MLWKGRFVNPPRRMDTLWIVSAFLMLAAVVFLVMIVSVWHSFSAPSRVQFLGNINMAIEKARRERKPILLDVHSDDSVWCVRMNREVYSRADIASMLSRDFVPLQLNPERSRKSRAFCRRLGFKTYPFVMVIDSRGNEITRITDYVPADEFVDTVVEARQRAMVMETVPALPEANSKQ